jgi:glycosyltransferase involved in cell wall biosynthesis
MAGGGIGIFAETMAEALVKLGVEVWVVGYGRKTRRPFVQNGVSVFWLSLPSFLYRTLSFRGYPYSVAGIIRRHVLSLQMNRLVREQRIDVVESYDFNGPLAIKPPRKLVVRLHGSVSAYRLGEGRPHAIHPMDRYYELKQLRIADHLIAVSHHIGELTSQAFGCSLDYRVIYNAVDTSFFTAQSSAPDGSLLFVGNVMWRKGVFDLIRALPLVLEENPSIFLKIVGGVGGIHKQHLSEALAAISETARRRVRLLGQVRHEELPALYNQASVFVFPSRAEAFGLTCVEAMACGRPVVATRLASGPELVEDGISGLLADPANPANLAEKINILLRDSELAQRLGTNARRQVLEKFDLRDLGQRNLDYYQSVLQGSG